MTVTVEVKVIEDMEKQIKRLTRELKDLKKEENGFEKLDTDVFLIEAYN